MYEQTEPNIIAAVKIKAVLAADIIRALDERGLSVRAAADAHGLGVEELTRIRTGELTGLTQERLARILELLQSRTKDERQR